MSPSTQTESTIIDPTFLLGPGSVPEVSPPMTEEATQQTPDRMLFQFYLEQVYGALQNYLTDPANQHTKEKAELIAAICHQLAETHHKEVYAVNHLEGHLLSVLAEKNARTQTEQKQPPEVQLPILGLIISGGNSLFVKVTAWGTYEILGQSIDDAAGEALDKVGRMLGLGYPAGPVIEQFARRGDRAAYKFPLPMTTSGDYNLSFSGLKTFARNLIEELGGPDKLSQQQTYDLCASFQWAVFRHILHKLNKLLGDHPDLGQVWLGGGVAANIKFRELLRTELRQYGLKLRVPYTKKLCGDNAAMIGVAAGLVKRQPSEPAELDRKPRWSF